MARGDNRRDPRVYGDGQTAVTPIEGAARLGYEDGILGRPFDPEYATQQGQWQRNYEAGRQWAVALLAVGLLPPAWRDGERVPAALLNHLAEVRRITGTGTRPEDTPVYQRPEPDDAPLHAMVPVRQGRNPSREGA
jgi:hypothetical protein